MILQRSELRRIRILHVLTLILAAFVLTGAVSISTTSELGRAVLIAGAVIAAAAVVLCVIQLYGYPRRSQILLFQNEDAVVIATNALHEGFKLRFLRDIFGEHVSAFNDEDRLRWKGIEADGFYATLYIREVRKVILLRLCTMIFDDVFFVDSNGRWEHHDSSSTSEPSFSRREMPRLTGWKSST